MKKRPERAYPYEKYCTNLPFDSGVVISKVIVDFRLQIS
jgi:hypothetical protein